MNDRDKDLQNVEADLITLYRRIRSFTTRAARAIHPDLEGVAYPLLVRIDEVGPVRSSDLAAHFGVGKPTMSRQLSSLEKLGLVERTRNATDARSQLISLNDEARQKVRTVRAGSVEAFRRQFDSWGDADLSALSTSLEKLLALPDHQPE